LTKNGEPSSSTSSCNHANIIEENTRLKDEFSKSTIPIGEKNLNDLLSNRRSNNVKNRLGYVSKEKKKKKSNKKKTKAKHAQANKDPIVGGDAARGKATHDDFAGNANPHYVLFCDYYGDVYAKYVGPHDEYIA
jgi:hypothetical protein